MKIICISGIERCICCSMICLLFQIKLMKIICISGIECHICYSNMLVISDKLDEDYLYKWYRTLYLLVISDKIDEDYLYRWYRTLYLLFHEAGFRLYHTSASDPLCLQVTMMESCRYYMSWVQNPGPKTFVVYPPAIDGMCCIECYTNLHVHIHFLAHIFMHIHMLSKTYICSHI